MSFPPGSPALCFLHPHPSAWVSCPLFVAKQHPVLPPPSTYHVVLQLLVFWSVSLPLPHPFEDETLCCPCLYPMSLEQQKYLLNEWSGPDPFKKDKNSTFCASFTKSNDFRPSSSIPLINPPVWQGLKKTNIYWGSTVCQVPRQTLYM